MTAIATGKFHDSSWDDFIIAESSFYNRSLFFDLYFF
jgi:hypothetical protein